MPWTEQSQYLVNWVDEKQSRTIGMDELQTRMSLDVMHALFTVGFAPIRKGFPVEPIPVHYGPFYRALVVSWSHDVSWLSSEFW